MRWSLLDWLVTAHHQTVRSSWWHHTWYVSSSGPSSCGLSLTKLEGWMLGLILVVGRGIARQARVERASRILSDPSKGYIHPESLEEDDPGFCVATTSTHLPTPNSPSKPCGSRDLRGSS